MASENEATSPSCSKSAIVVSSGDESADFDDTTDNSTSTFFSSEEDEHDEYDDDNDFLSSDETKKEVSECYLDTWKLFDKPLPAYHSDPKTYLETIRKKDGSPCFLCLVETDHRCKYDCLVGMHPVYFCVEHYSLIGHYFGFDRCYCCRVLAGQVTMQTSIIKKRRRYIQA
jgi:hypothetical protein